MEGRRPLSSAEQRKRSFEVVEFNNVATFEWVAQSRHSDRILGNRQWTSVLPLSVVKHFRLREMGGLPKFTNARSEMGVSRLLVKSRAPICTENETGEDFEAVVPSKLEVSTAGNLKKSRQSKEADLNYTYLTLKNSSEVIFMDENIFILSTAETKKEILATECNTWLSTGLARQYSLWVENNSSPSSPRNATVKIQVMKAVKTKGSATAQECWVLVLMCCSNKLSTYNLQSGKLLDTIDLEGLVGNPGFSCEGFSCIVQSLIGPCIKLERSITSVPSDVKFEFLLLSVMPLSVKYRIQIFKQALLDVSVTKYGALDGNLLYYYCNNAFSQVTYLSDVEEMITNNAGSTVELSSTDLRFNGMKCVGVKKRPTALASFNMQLSSVNPWSFPPCVLGRNASGKFIICSLSTHTPLYEIAVPQEMNVEPSFSNYSSTGSEIVLSGMPHGFCIFRLDASEDEAEPLATCSRTFSTHSLSSGSENYVFGYDSKLSLIAAVEADICEGYIQVYMYDNQTKDLVLKLKPMCVKQHYPEDLLADSHNQPKVVVNFSNFRIAISVSYTRSGFIPQSCHVYFVNLLGKCVNAQ